MAWEHFVEIRFMNFPDEDCKANFQRTPKDAANPS